MDIQLFTQPKLDDGKDFCLGERLFSLLTSKRPKTQKATLFFGLIKENAYEKTFEALKAFTDNGGDLTFYMSMDRKGNIKKIITSLLEIGCKVFLFKGAENDYISDFQYKGAIFESTKKGTVLLSSGNFSLSGLYEGYNTVTEIIYDLAEDKKEFKSFQKKLFPQNTMISFVPVSLGNINEVIMHEKSQIPSIEEFTQKDVSTTNAVDTSLDDVSIDIEIDKDVDFLVAPVEIEKPREKKKVEKKASAPSKYSVAPIEDVEFEGTKYYMGDDALDIEDMLFTVSSQKAPKKVAPKENPRKALLEEPIVEQGDSEGKILTTKVADLSKTSIFMVQAPKITKKGASAGEIKIPTYLRDLVPGFWEWPKQYSIAKNSIEKARICMLKVIDTQNAEDIITDVKAKLFQREGENTFIILSDALINMDIQENDILRFIKTQGKEGTYYTCEIVRANAKEYPIWEQFCTHLLKGSKRKYGVM